MEDQKQAGPAGDPEEQKGLGSAHTQWPLSFAFMSIIFGCH